MSFTSQWGSIQKSQPYWHHDHRLSTFRAGGENIACVSCQYVITAPAVDPCMVWLGRRVLTQSSLERFPCGNYVSMVLWLILYLLLARVLTQSSVGGCGLSPRASNMTKHYCLFTSKDKGWHPLHSVSEDLWTLERWVGESEMTHNTCPHIGRHGEVRK